MSVEQAASSALLMARARIRGPVRIDDQPERPATPEGVVELTDPADGSAWLLPTWPDGVSPSLLAEYDLAPVPIERAGETRRALAAVLRCCWPELAGAPWPGVSARVEAVTGLFAELTRGDADLQSRWAVGALRRLHESGWVRLDRLAGLVSVGPRVAAWPEESLGGLREMLRRLPLGDHPAGVPGSGPGGDVDRVDQDGATAE